MKRINVYFTLRATALDIFTVDMLYCISYMKSVYYVSILLVIQLG